MKNKILILFALIIVIVTPFIINEYVNYNKNSKEREIIEFSYKGHDYIGFRRQVGFSGYGGVVHNPECHCLKDSL